MVDGLAEVFSFLSASAVGTLSVEDQTVNIVRVQTLQSQFQPFSSLGLCSTKEVVGDMSVDEWGSLRAWGLPAVGADSG